MNKNEKKILYIGGFELPDKNAAAHRVVSNAKVLKELNYKVNFIGISKSINDNITIFEQKYINNEFAYYSIPYPKKWKDWFKYLINISYYDIIQKINPQIIIAYNYPALALQKLMNYCHKNNIKIVADVTEWYQPEGHLLYRLLKTIDTSYRMRILHKKMNGLIVISRFLFDYYKTYNDNIIEVPPLVDLSMEKWNVKRVKQRESDIIQLIYAGSPGKNKDCIDIIIKIIYNINTRNEKKLQLKIVGIDKDQYINTYLVDKDIIENLDDFVEFYGRLSHVDTIKEIANSDFHIFIRENNKINIAGFPTKFVESFACGTPVITNLSSNLGDYLFDNVNGIILDNENYDSLYSSFLKILSLDKNKMNEMKKKCKKCKKFNYHQYTSSFDNFFQQVFKT